MKLAWVGWLLVGCVAFALGAVAEACGGSVEGGGNPPNCIGCGTSPTPPSSSTPSGPGPSCATLAACCTSLPSGALGSCENLSSSGPEAACAEELALLDSQGFCGSTGTGTSTTIGFSTSSTSFSSSSNSGGGAPDAGCHKPPPALHPEVTPGVYCPFSGDGGDSQTCTGGHCCEPAAGGSACTPDSTACPTGDTDWQCGSPVDCAAGLSCCGTGNLLTQAACGDVPPYPYVSGFKGTTCAASCNTGMFNGGMLGFVVCSQQSECPVGTCAPIEPKGGGTGYCAGPDGSPVFGGSGSGTSLDAG
jgi:hypothetical protein